MWAVVCVFLFSRTLCATHCTWRCTLFGETLRCGCCCVVTVVLCRCCCCVLSKARAPWLLTRQVQEDCLRIGPDCRACKLGGRVSEGVRVGSPHPPPAQCLRLCAFAFLCGGSCGRWWAQPAALARQGLTSVSYTWETPCMLACGRWLAAGQCCCTYLGVTWWLWTCWLVVLLAHRGSSTPQTRSLLLSPCRC